MFLVEGGGDASTVGVYLENPIHLRDKKGVRLKMHKQVRLLISLQISSKRTETSSDASTGVWTSPRRFTKGGSKRF